MTDQDKEHNAVDVTTAAPTTDVSKIVTPNIVAAVQPPETTANIVFQNVGQNIHKPTILSNVMCTLGGLLALTGLILVIIGKIESDNNDQCAPATCCYQGTCINRNFANCFCCSKDSCRICPAPYEFVHDSLSCNNYDEYRNMLVAGIILLVVGPIIFCCPICCAMCCNCGFGTFLTQ